MKVIRAAVTAALASTLVAAPVVAQAAPVADARNASSVEGEQLGGFGLGWILAVLIAIAVVVIVVSDEDETAPRSP